MRKISLHSFKRTHKINRLYDYQDEFETAHHGKVQNLDPWSTDRVYQWKPYTRKTNTIVNNNKIRKMKKKEEFTRIFQLILKYFNFLWITCKREETSNIKTKTWKWVCGDIRRLLV